MSAVAAPPEMSGGKKKNRMVPWVAGLVLAVAALLFSFFGITRSLRHDECCSVEISNTGWPGIIENLKVNAHTPPLYYFLLNLWMKLFGTGEASVRSLSAVFYILCLAAIYHLGKTLYDRKTGLLVAFLFMVSPMAIWHAQDGRMYSLLPFVGLLSMFYFFRLFFQPGGTRADFTLFVSVNILGTLTHYWFFFVLAAQGAAVLLLVSRSAFKKFLVAGLLSVVPFLALWTPVFLQQLTNGGTSWMTRPGWGELFSSFLYFYGGGKLGLLVYGCALGVALLEWQGFKIKVRNYAAFKEFALQKVNAALLFLAVFSLLLAWLVSQLSSVYVANRYTVIALAPMALLLAAFLARLGKKPVVLAFCAILLSGVLANFLTRRTASPASSYRTIADHLIQNAGRQNVLILSTSSRAGLDYYLRLRGAEEKFIRFSFPAEMAEHPCWTDIPRWLQDKQKLEREAAALVARIDSITGTGGARIWFLSGGHLEIDAFIQDRLKVRFRLQNEAIGASSPPGWKETVWFYQKE